MYMQARDIFPYGSVHVCKMITVISIDVGRIVCGKPLRNGRVSVCVCAPLIDSSGRFAVEVGRGQQISVDGMLPRDMQAT